MSDPFAEHRDVLFTVAYEMLGSAEDAEDVVQEAWLRWAAADREDVGNPRAYAAPTWPTTWCSPSRCRWRCSWSMTP